MNPLMFARMSPIPNMPGAPNTSGTMSASSAAALGLGYLLANYGHHLDPTLFFTCVFLLLPLAFEGMCFHVDSDDIQESNFAMALGNETVLAIVDSDVCSASCPESTRLWRGVLYLFDPLLIGVLVLTGLAYGGCRRYPPLPNSECKVGPSQSPSGLPRLWLN